MKLKLRAVVLILAFCLLTHGISGFIHASDYYPPDFYVMVNSSEGEINYRAGAGTEYAVMGSLSNGTVLHITDILYHPSDGFFWGQTSYNGYYGWVSLRQTNILKDGGYTAPDYYAVVTADGGSLNLRTGPGTSYSAYFEIPNGQQLHITDMIYNPEDGFFWGYTYYNGYAGYVSLRQTTVMRGNYASGYEDNSIPASSYQVSIYGTDWEGLALKAAPDANSTRYVMIPENEVITISQVSDNGWGYTSYNGYSGWVSLRYTKIIGDYASEFPSYGYMEPVYYTIYNTEGEGLEQRSKPTVESSTFGPIYDGTSVMVQAIQDGWAYIYYNGHYGWSNLGYMYVSGSQVATPTAAVHAPVSTDNVLSDNSFPTTSNMNNKNDELVSENIVGNWEYGFTQFDVQFGFYRDGYCFYEDGTGLDVFWNEMFTYQAEGNRVQIIYDDSQYPPVTMIYSIEHRDQINGIISADGFDILHLQIEGTEDQGGSFLHIPDDVFSRAEIMENQSESWDDYWIISSEDGEHVTIEYRSMYYGYGDIVRIIPETIKGHKVIRMNGAVRDGETLEYVIVPEGVEALGSTTFNNSDIHYLSLPRSLQYIADDAFYYYDDYRYFADHLVLLVYAGSYAESYAQAHNINYQIIPDTVDDIEAYILGLGNFLGDLTPEFASVRNRLTGQWAGAAPGISYNISYDTIIMRNNYMGTDYPEIYDEQSYTYEITRMGYGKGYMIRLLNMQGGNAKIVKYYYEDEPDKLYGYDKESYKDCWFKVR